MEGGRRLFLLIADRYFFWCHRGESMGIPKPALHYHLDIQTRESITGLYYGELAKGS